MPSKADPADAHLRVMEERIKAQSAFVQSLNQNAQDASGAVRRLNVLLKALEEMRLHLPQLAETDMDKKNGRSDALMTRLLGKKVA
jgi:CHAD domain-containing protein